MMNILRRTKLSAALCAAGIGLSIAHQASAEVTTKISGYGTLAGTVTDEGDLQFRSSLNQSKGAGDKLDLGVDSRLGLQGNVNFGSGLSVTAQLLGQRRRTDDSPTSNEDFGVAFEWLYGQYSPTSNIDLRVGRVVLPAFMISDSRNVGYTQPWLRAPISVYAQMPLRTVDGIQGTFRIPAGPAVVSIQPTYGESSYNVSSGGTVLKNTSHPVLGLNATVEYGDWLVRAGQVRGTSHLKNLKLAPLAPGFDHKMKDVFTSVGLQFDNGTAVLMTEWAQREQNNVEATPLTTFLTVAGRPLSATRSWYVAGGWRFGKWLPMLSYGENRNSLTSDKAREPSVSLRYDLMTNVAIKAQVSRYDGKSREAFVLSNPAKDKVNVFAIGVDFVF